MNQSELLELLKNGENSKLEFKEDDIESRDMAKGIVAFANSEGGIIIIGVDDKGMPVGIKRDIKHLEEWVINICRNNCHPSIIPIFEKIVIDKKSLGIVTIRKREGIVHRTSDGHYYIRVGSTVRDATPEELARLFQFAGVIHHDIAPVYNTSVSDIDEDRLQYYFSNILHTNIDIRDKFKELDKNKELIERLLENIKVMVRIEGQYYLTISGLLIFGKYPERLLPQAGIIAVRFRGEEMDYNMVDKKEIIGSLINQYDYKGEIISEGGIEQAIKFVQSHTPISSRMEGVRRIDIPQYPVESIREGIVNAVGHRNYAITGSKIRLLIFSNRIEIHSPGKLPNTVTIENIKRTAHYTRNPELYKLLAQHGYAEDIGLGIPQKIIQRMISHNGKEPKLEESGEGFILTLFG